MPWAKERMPELFEGLKIIENGDDVITITKVDTLTGECHINTRKGKIFHFFEFELKLKWKGALPPGVGAVWLLRLLTCVWRV